MGFCKNPRKICPQILATFCASLSFLVLGSLRGWTSPGLPSLFESGGVPDLNPSVDEPWLASTPLLCAIPGALLASWPLQKFGRKWTMVATAIPAILGFLLIGFAQNKAMLYAGRVLGGIMEGLVAPAAQVYVTEISSPRIRGVLGSITASSLAAGVLIAYFIGAYVPWDTASLILTSFALLFATTVSFLPESPVWLLTQREDEKARKALQFYRGGHTDVDEELLRMRENAEKTLALQESATMKDFFRVPVLKPLFLSMALMFFQQFVAISIVDAYTVKIFAMSGSTVDKHTATIVIGALSTVCCFVASYAVDITGRRILLLVSGFVMAVSLFAMGAFFYMKELWGDQEAETNLGWLPLASLIVYMIGFSLGFGTVPFVIMGEIFPLRFRHILSPISSCFFELTSFVSVLTFTDISVSFRVYGAFWFYASWAVVAVIFVYFFLPETSGKTLEEMEDLFDPDATQRKEFAAVEQRRNRRRSSAQPELTNPRRGSLTFVSTVAAAAAATVMKSKETPSHGGALELSTAAYNRGFVLNE